MVITWELLRQQAEDADRRATEALVLMGYAERTWEAPEDRRVFLRLAFQQLSATPGCTLASQDAFRQHAIQFTREATETALTQRQAAWAAWDAMEAFPS